jgi:hypothetical protein
MFFMSYITDIGYENPFLRFFLSSVNGYTASPPFMVVYPNLGSQLVDADDWLIGGAEMPGLDLWNLLPIIAVRCVLAPRVQADIARN